MKALGELYYNFGIDLFEEGYYELAVEKLIEAFDLGYDRQLNEKTSKKKKEEAG